MNAKTIVASGATRAAAVTTAAVAALALAAGPAAAQSGELPSYATGEERISGRIASIDDKYHLHVRDDRGYIDSVTLRDGTIINPTGLRLVAGQSVTILGHNGGTSFMANEIDTPYARTGFAPVYGYPAYPYRVYAYPAYGYPYAYRAYPAFSLGVRTPGFAFRGVF